MEWSKLSGFQPWRRVHASTKTYPTPKPSFARYFPLSRIRGSRSVPRWYPYCTLCVDSLASSVSMPVGVFKVIRLTAEDVVNCLLGLGRGEHHHALVVL